MIAGLASGIEGVSARYAAQIQELLYVQTIRRMVADQEAARAQIQADRAELIRSVRSHVVDEPVKVDIETSRAEPSNPVKQPEAKESVSAALAPVPPAQIFDIKA